MRHMTTLQRGRRRTCRGGPGTGPLVHPVICWVFCIQPVPCWFLIRWLGLGSVSFLLWHCNGLLCLTCSTEKPPNSRPPLQPMGNGRQHRLIPGTVDAFCQPRMHACIAFKGTRDSALSLEINNASQTGHRHQQRLQNYRHVLAEAKTWQPDGFSGDQAIVTVSIL